VPPGICRRREHRSFAARVELARRSCGTWEVPVTYAATGTQPLVCSARRPLEVSIPLRGFVSRADERDAGYLAMTRVGWANGYCSPLERKGGSRSALPLHLFVATPTRSHRLTSVTVSVPARSAHRACQPVPQTADRRANSIASLGKIDGLPTGSGALRRRWL